MYTFKKVIRSKKITMECSICLMSSYELKETKVTLISYQCGHKLCFNCLATTLFSTEDTLNCHLCRFQISDCEHLNNTKENFRTSKNTTLNYNEVNRIHAKRTFGARIEFLVSWTGYDRYITQK